MGVQYGLNFTASDAKNYLEKNQRQNNGVKTWQQLFGNTSLAATAQSDMIKQSYGDVIAQAYASNLKNQNAIYGAGLNTGATNELLNKNSDMLSNAYEQYMQQYADDVGTLQTNYQKAVDSINAELNTEAENYAKLLNNAYKYTKDELQYSTYRGIDNEFANMFITRDEVDKGKYDSAMEGQLKDWNTIAREYNIVDDNGNLSTGAQKFFDMVFNAAPHTTLYTSKDGDQRYTRSFDEWLSDTDNDLRTWYQSADPYNYTKAGNKFGSVKQTVGLESDDYKYHQSEYVDPTKKEFQLITLDEVKGNIDKFVEQNIEKFKIAFGSEAYNEVADDISSGLTEYNEAKIEYDSASKEYNKQKDKVFKKLQSELKMYDSVNDKSGYEPEFYKNVYMKYRKYFTDPSSGDFFKLKKGMEDEFYNLFNNDEFYDLSNDGKYAMKSYYDKFTGSKQRNDDAETYIIRYIENAFKNTADKPKKKSGY